MQALDQKKEADKEFEVSTQCGRQIRQKYRGKLAKTAGESGA